MSANDLADRLDFCIAQQEDTNVGKAGVTVVDTDVLGAAAVLLREQAEQLDTLRNELDAAQLRSIEARNPGIDMDEVRASRAACR